MKLLGIEFGRKMPEVSRLPEKGEGEFFEIKTGDRIQRTRQGAGLVEIRGKTTIIEKGRVNIDAYKGLIDY